MSPTGTRACFEAAMEGLKLPPLPVGVRPEAYPNFVGQHAVDGHIQSALEFAQKGDVTGCRECLVLVEAMLHGPVDTPPPDPVKELQKKAAEVCGQGIDYKLNKAQKRYEERDLLLALLEVVTPALAHITTNVGKYKVVKVPSSQGKLYLDDEGQFFVIQTGTNGSIERAFKVPVEEALDLSSAAAIARRLSEVLDCELQGGRKARSREIREEAATLRAVTTLLRGMR